MGFDAAGRSYWFGDILGRGGGCLLFTLLTLFQVSEGVCLLFTYKYFYILQGAGARGNRREVGPKTVRILS